jgi:hypothetical protein
MSGITLGVIHTFLARGIWYKTTISYGSMMQPLLDLLSRAEKCLLHYKPGWLALSV